MALTPVVLLGLFGLPFVVSGAWTVLNAARIEQHLRRPGRRSHALWEWRAAGVLNTGVGVFIIVVGVLFGVGYLPRT